MPGYADVEDPVALLNRAPDTSGGPKVEDAVRDAGFEVQAVDWVWRKVVGESLVDSIIKPITGDFEKISQQAGEWTNVKDALQAIRNNLNAGLGELQPAWNGDAADQFRNLIGTTWTLGIEADAQAASLIGFALNKVADGSRRACDQCLRLIKMLVDKLIEAAAMLPIPVVGWGRAVKLVYDGIQIYNAIMQLIEGIKAIITGAQQVIQGIQQVGTAISKIKDIHNLNDALNVANEAGQGIATTASGAHAVAGGASQVTGAAGDLAHHASSAHDNARGLHDERAAARDHGDGTDAAGTTTGRRNGSTTGQDQSGRIRDNNEDPRGNGRPTADRPACGDPIDVATGHMMLTQTDVELAGVLPLIVERAHISSYRVGRWFGRSWASTLDQRLEVDALGVCFAAADGMLLRYPTPDGTAVLPDEGPRWPLSRTVDGGYAITNPDSGQTMHFAPAQAAALPITAISDRNGHRIEFDYGPDGAPTRIRHHGGYRIGVDSSNGLITALRLLGAEHDAELVLMRYRYDEAGRLTDVINSSGSALRFEYDHDGRITRWLDRNDQWYSYRYDERGRCVRAEGSGGFLSYTFDYDSDSRVTVATNSLGQATTFHLNEAHQVVTETNPLGHSTASEWDRYDRLLSRTDPLGRVTRYGYDDDGNLTAVTRPDGSQVTAGYDELGLPVTIAEPSGAVWRQAFDDRGNRTTVTNPAGATTTFAYDENGHLITVTDAMGQVTRVDNAATGMPVAVADPLGGTTRYARDTCGRVVSITNPVGGVTRFGWTAEGNLAWRTRPDGATERWAYDGEGNLVEHVDTTGLATRTEIGPFDLPVARTAADGTRHTFAYDTELRLTAVTNPQGLVWRYVYDAAGNLVEETDFNARVISYAHDSAGQLSERTNGLSQTTSFIRDALGNIVEQRGADAVTTFAYDAAGRMVRATNADAEVTFDRDPLGRVLAETCNGRVITSGYDALGRRVHRRTPSGAESVWEYDANDQPVALHTAGQTLRFGYDASGREIERRFGAATLAQTWDANHRLRTQVLTAAGSAQGARLVQRRSYSYRLDGNVTAIVDQLSGPRQFDLDPSGRVTGVHGNGWTERYAYDPAGNVTQAQWPQQAGAEAMGQREYAGTLIRGAGNVRYQHDAQGRMVLRQRKRLSAKPETWHYSWDADDRLVAVTTPDGTRWRYLYDPLGRRIAKQRLADGSVADQVDFSWDGAVLAEQTGTGDTDRTTVWNWEPGGFRPVSQAERVSARDADQGWIDRQFYAIVTDLVGAPVELVDPTGNIAWHSNATLWGTMLPQTSGSAYTPLRFPGQYFDPETQLNYNFQRYYDPETGRYSSADPLGLSAGPNDHAYVANPTNWLDPLGLTPCGRKIKDTRGLSHSFDEHSAQWFGREVPKSSHLEHWENLVSKASQSNKTFDWSTGSSATTAHLARVEGKYFVVQFFKDGPREGELATAFVPNNSQLGAMLRAAGIN